MIEYLQANLDWDLDRDFENLYDQVVEDHPEWLDIGSHSSSIDSPVSESD